MSYKIGVYIFILGIVASILMLISPLYLNFNLLTLDEAISQEFYLSLLFSLKNSSVAVIISLAAGIVLATILEHNFARIKIIFYIVAASSMILPTVLTMASWFKLLNLYTKLSIVYDLEQTGLINFLYSSGGITLTYVFYNLPLATLIMGVSLNQIPRNDFLLARQLRFNFFQYCVFLYWPNMKRAMTKVIFLTFLFCFQDFSISYTLGSTPGNTSLPVLIYQKLVYDNALEITVILSILQMLVNLVGILALYFIDSGKLLYLQAQKSKENIIKPSISKISTASANIIVCIGLAFISIPFITSLITMFESIITGNFINLLLKLLNISGLEQSLYISIKIATTSGLLATILAYWHLVFTEKFKDGLLGNMLKVLPWLWLIFPQAILGLGLFLFLKNTELLFISGYWQSLAILNSLIYSPILIYFWQEPFLNLRNQYRNLSSNLRLTFLQKLYILDWLVLGKNFYLGFCIVTAFTLGDLTLITFLGSDFETLTTLYSNLINSYRFNSAQILQLFFIVLIGFIFLPNLWWVIKNKTGGLFAKNQ